MWKRTQPMFNDSNNTSAENLDNWESGLSLLAQSRQCRLQYSPGDCLAWQRRANDHRAVSRVLGLIQLNHLGNRLWQLLKAPVFQLHIYCMLHLHHHSNITPYKLSTQDITLYLLHSALYGGGAGFHFHWCQFDLKQGQVRLGEVTGRQESEWDLAVAYDINNLMKQGRVKWGEFNLGQAKSGDVADRQTEWVRPCCSRWRR